MPTLSGLALALGFERRTDLLAAAETNAEIRRLLLQLESRLEEKLYARDSSVGARFVLESMLGWDKPENAQSPSAVLKVEVVDE